MVAQNLMNLQMCFNIVTELIHDTVTTMCAVNVTNDQ